MLRLGIGTGIGGPAPAAGGGLDSPNPNLLLWSEEFQQAAWTGASAVSANSVADPLGGTTADRVTIASGGQHVQVTTVAAAAGASVFSPRTLSAGVPTRVSATGTFNGVAYVYSEYLASPDSADISLSIYRSGGFLVVGLTDTSDLGDPLVIDRWGAKLETPDLTDYVKREGT